MASVENALGSIRRRTNFSGGVSRLRDNTVEAVILLSVTKLQLLSLILQNQVNDEKLAAGLSSRILCVGMFHQTTMKYIVFLL